MALHIKSTKWFKILIAISALLVSAMAATFSITGIATLFSGYFFTVSLMMGSLEFAKIVVASFMARYWSSISKVLRSYFMIALTVLILVTSGGIFGYLTDAYQKTKGDYTIVEKQTNILTAKKNMFYERKERLQNDRALELKAKNSNQTRADSLSSRGQNITRTREDIKFNDVRIAEIEKQITAAEDSMSAYDLRIIELESQNIKGDIGPLKNIAIIFNTDMDTVVKYFVFMLIFVFDPLAVLLFVSLNMIIRKEHEHSGFEDEEDIQIMSSTNKKRKQPEIINEVGFDAIEDDGEVQMNLEKDVKNNIENKVDKIVSVPETAVTNIDEPKEKEDLDSKQHEFYHSDDVTQQQDETHVTIKSSNYHPNSITE